MFYFTVGLLFQEDSPFQAAVHDKSSTSGGSLQAALHERTHANLPWGQSQGTTVQVRSDSDLSDHYPCQVAKPLSDQGARLLPRPRPSHDRRVVPRAGEETWPQAGGSATIQAKEVAEFSTLEQYLLQEQEQLPPHQRVEAREVTFCPDMSTISPT